MTRLSVSPSSPCFGSLFYIGVENAFLLQVVGHGILGKKRRLEADFGADPFAFGVRGIRRVVAAASAAKLRTEVGGLDLVEVADLAPGRIANRARDVDFKLQNRHRRETLGG